MIDDVIRKTIFNQIWLDANRKSLVELFPDTWTDAKNVNMMMLGYRFKVLGIDWKTDAEFGKVMVALGKVKVYDADYGDMKHMTGDVDDCDFIPQCPRIKKGDVDKIIMPGVTTGYYSGCKAVTENTDLIMTVTGDGDATTSKKCTIQA